MMDWTDRHCRFFHRLLSPHARLYTEMLHAHAVVHGDRDRLLAYNLEEHPVALQLGGCDPATLALAAKIGEERGYDEINLNVGCPSDRVQTGRFGACLMRQPALVGDCISAMQAAVKIPVTVKCRIGVDDQDATQALPEFVDHVARAGCRQFIVHARKAWLQGLSPKENREVPPLDYPLVHALKQARPELVIVVNGGIAAIENATAQLEHVDGVMLGRIAYHQPYFLAELEQRLFGLGAMPQRDAVLEGMIEYAEARLAEGARLQGIVRHLLGLYHGEPGARNFRRILSCESHRSDAGAEVLRKAMKAVEPSFHH